MKSVLKRAQPHRARAESAAPHLGAAGSGRRPAMPEEEKGNSHVRARAATIASERKAELHALTELWERYQALAGQDRPVEEWLLREELVITLHEARGRASKAFLDARRG